MAKTTEDQEEQRLRLERKIAAAKALGLWEKILDEGWGGLTSRESGAIGAFVARRMPISDDFAPPRP